MALKATDFVKEEGSKGDYKEVRELMQLSHALLIKYQGTLPQYFATLDTRLLALGVDYFIAFFVYVMIALLYVAATVPSEERLAHLLLGLIIVPVIKFAISVWSEGSPRQATAGKLLIGIKVTDTAGRPIGYAHALGRNLAKLIGILTLGIGFLSGFFDRRQQCLHDKIAQTLVIKDRLV